MKSLPKPEGEFIISELGDEFLAYQQSVEKAHCLSLVGGLVLKSSIAGETIANAQARLASVGVENPAAVLEQTVAHLQEKGLLAGTGGDFDRRRFLVAAGAALAAVPVLASVGLPDPAQAASCQVCSNITITNSPDCVQCSLPCKFGAGSACPGSSQRCTFGYRIDTANDPQGSAACQGEKFGVHTCQAVIAYDGTTGLDGTNGNIATFHPQCSVIRIAVRNSGRGDGVQYYCCDCDGVNVVSGSLDNVNCDK